jgi:Asp-tRNA(Asn)/Glu-tRNA(Gln) amidotransferase A subunit family amidase
MTTYWRRLDIAHRTGLAARGRSPEGYPLGIQLVGAVGSEELLLDVAQAFESIHPWQSLFHIEGVTRPRPLRKTAIV